MNADYVKLVIFTPTSHADIVREAIGNAGAGKIGNYSNCTFSSKGEGRFLPLQGANPTIGQIGKLEKVEEERIEAICLKSNAKAVIESVKKDHPYEEVAFDIIPLLMEDDL